MKNIIVAAAIAASTFAAVIPAQAQNVQAVINGCSANPTACAALLQAAVRGLPEAEANALLGSLAGSLVEAAKANPGLSSELGDALGAVAELSTDPAQKSALAEVAEAVASGNAGDVDTGPVGQSGN